MISDLTWVGLTFKGLLPAHDLKSSDIGLIANAPRRLFLANSGSSIAGNLKNLPLSDLLQLTLTNFTLVLIKCLVTVHVLYCSLGSFTEQRISQLLHLKIPTNKTMRITSEWNPFRMCNVIQSLGRVYLPSVALFFLTELSTINYSGNPTNNEQLMSVLAGLFVPTMLCSR